MLCHIIYVRREKASIFNGVNPTRQLSLQPVAIRVVVEATKLPKPSMERDAKATPRAGRP
jgi:hypothetical protein